MAQIRQRAHNGSGGGGTSSALPARASPSPSPARTTATTAATAKQAAVANSVRVSSCSRLCTLLHRILRLVLLLAAVAGALFVVVEFHRLNAAYWHPLHAPLYTPTREHNLMLSLGHSTSTPGGLSSIVMWMHCNAKCRAFLCRQWQDPKLWGECEAKALFLVDAGMGPVAPSTRLSDDVLLFNLTDLSPCAPVRYRIVFVVHGEASDILGHMSVKTGQFVMGPRDGEKSCIGRLPPPMHANGTLSGEPEPAVRFVFGSCLGISPSHSIRAFEYLGRTQEEKRTDFVLLLGDIIYADAPHIEDERAYLQVWHDAGTRALLQRVPLMGMFDDHEIYNDWSLADSHERFAVAMRWFDLFVGARNPPSPVWNETRQGPMPPAAPRLMPGETSFELDVAVHGSAVVKPRYYSFDRGTAASFFVLDTRQYASPPPERGGPSDPARRTKLGAVQLAHLLDWLRTTPATFKFIASPVAWASGVFKFVQDGWAAFEFERDLIFDYIVAHRITGVVLLSADLHWAGCMHFKRWNLVEFTISPIQSFGLPAHVRHDDNQELQYQSMWRNHFGEMEVFDDDAAPTGTAGKDAGNNAGPYLNLNIYRYRYDEPKIVHRVRINLSDMAPGPADRSPAQQTEIEPSLWIGL